MTLDKRLFFEQLAEFLSVKGIRSYLVGGCVRDLLMQVEIKDFDVMLEADATEVLLRLYREQDFVYPVLKPVVFKKYKTAKIKFLKVGNSDDRALEVDFSSARKEIYPEIAAAPICSSATLEQDLARRDFSINAIAFALGALDNAIDLFDGINDLKEKKIKVLHELSFRDDPIRLLRAVRFICRFDFSLESKTEELFYHAVSVNYVKYLPEQRIFQELKKALQEDCWLEILRKLNDFGLLSQYSPLLAEAYKALDTVEIKAPDFNSRIEILVKNLSVEKMNELKNKFGIKNAN